MTRDLMLTEVVTSHADISVKEIIDILFKRHIGSVVIVDEANQCIGIFTERDAIRIVAQSLPTRFNSRKSHD